METLEQRLATADLQGLPDWEVAEKLNAPDASLPEVIEIISGTKIGVPEVLEALGGDVGAAFLDALKTAATQRRLFAYVEPLLINRDLDAGSAQVRSEIQAMAANGMITEQMASLLLRLGEKRYHPSWAEYNNVVVTPRTVGLARGGI